MAGWLVVLVLTNVASLVAIALLVRRHRPAASSEDVFVAPRPAGVTTRSRRVITIEVLNPIELVSSRGRVAGLAGSLAPGLARRVVYDQVLKTLRRELAGKQVMADVNLHHLRPQPAEASPALHTEPPAEVDEVLPVDLDHIADDQL